VSAGSTGVRRAAVDVGTNSVRLLVIDEAGRTLVREMTITRLGRRVDDLGHLDDEALARTLDTIEGYSRLWSAHGVDRDHVRIAATSAVRDVSDADRFFAGVRERTGVEARVLSGEQEARTAFLGATRAFVLTTGVTVLDIGGGSTELVVGDAAGEVAGSVSLQLGSVRLTERLLVSDPPTPRQLDAARAEIDRQLDRADQVLGEQGIVVDAAGTLVGVAGTVTTIAALDLGLRTYEPEAIHGHVLSRDAVARITAGLVAVPAARRAELGPIQPGREDVIHGGALILLGVLDHRGLDAVVVSERDILDGLAMAGCPG